MTSKKLLRLLKTSAKRIQCSASVNKSGGGLAELQNAVQLLTHQVSVLRKENRSLKNSSSSSSNGNQEFREFRSTITGMLENVRYEQKILQTAKQLLADAKFRQVEANIFKIFIGLKKTCLGVLK